jgi:hypothetical protein
VNGCERAGHTNTVVDVQSAQSIMLEVLTKSEHLKSEHFAPLLRVAIDVATRTRARTAVIG